MKKGEIAWQEKNERQGIFDSQGGGRLSRMSVFNKGGHECIWNPVRGIGSDHQNSCRK